MIKIDGSQGEGGGQILRSSLSLAMVTGQAVEIKNIRDNRSKPGVLRQHLTAIKAAAEVCSAEVEGAEMGARTLVFKPGWIKGGDYHFSVGTAGSSTLVFQTVLPALMLSNRPSSVIVEGGTHNKCAPPFEYLRDAFAPQLHRMGVGISLKLHRSGYYPAGGGKFVAEIAPVEELSAIFLEERGAKLPPKATAVLANIPEIVAERELKALEHDLKWDDLESASQYVKYAQGAGNILLLHLGYQHVCEVISEVGERGVRSELVARSVANQAWQYLATNAPVGEHLADQLLLPMAICGQGAFITGPLTLHTRTNIAVIEAFYGACITTEEIGGDMNRIEIKRK